MDNPIVLFAVAVALLAAVIGAIAAYKYGGRVALEAFLVKLFAVIDTVQEAVEYAERNYGSEDSQYKLEYVVDAALVTAKAQGIDGLLSRDLLLRIVEGTVTLAKRKQ